MTAVKLKVTQETQPATTQEFLYHQDVITIGSKPDNLLQLPDLQKRVVSRYHAKIARLDVIFQLIDLGSTNGTFLNGEKIERSQPYVIQNGDRLKIGDYVIEFFALLMEPEKPVVAPPNEANPFLNESNEFARALVGIGKKFFACAEDSARQENLQAALAEPLRQLAATEIGAIIKIVLEGLNGAAAGSDGQHIEPGNNGIAAKLRETQTALLALRQAEQRLQDENRQLRDLINAMGSSPQSAAPAAAAEHDDLAAQLREAQATIETLREENQGLQSMISAPTARLHQILDLILEAVTRLIAGSSQVEIELLGTIIRPPNFAKIYRSSGRELKEHLLNAKTSEKEKAEFANAIKQVLDRVIAHQVALLEGYRRCVNEVPQNLLQLLDPEKLSKDLAEDKQAKLSIFSEKKLWQAYRARYNELTGEDRRFFEEKIFRPAFLKGYNERMDSVWQEVAGVKQL